MKAHLYGDPDASKAPSPDDVVAKLVHEIEHYGLLRLFIVNLGSFPFEARKDLVQVTANLLRRRASGALASLTRAQPPPDLVVVDAIARSQPPLLATLLELYPSPELGLHYGTMLRDCIRHPLLAQKALALPEMSHLFTLVEAANFDIASDAFATLRDLLLRHRGLAARQILADYDGFFERYNALLTSANYVTRRQSLKLLGELLLDRANFTVMTRFIADADNLKTVMRLLRDQSAAIQFESFHVFKIFVANPNKPEPIRRILERNADRLLEFLENFQLENEDPQFVEERALLVSEIGRLVPTK
jgi:calcium binding protein 39